MKYVLIVVAIFNSSLVFGQFSLELYGGLGYDLGNVETKWTTTRHLEDWYNGYNAKFNISDPRSVGGLFLWKFSQQYDLSLGVNYRYTERDIIAEVYANSRDAFTQKLDVNVRNTALGLVLRKDIAINERSDLFLQAGITSEFRPGNNNGMSNFCMNEGEEVNVRDRQEVEYVSGEGLPSLVEILTSSTRGYQLTQGYTFMLTPKLKWGVSTTFAYQVESSADFYISAWLPNSQDYFEYSRTSLSFKSLFFETFIAYEF